MVAALKWKGASERPASALDVRHRMLAQAAENGDCATIEQLVSQGVPVDSETETGTTALMRAAAGGQLSAVCELVNLGASINKSRRDGFTPLMLAAFFGYEDLVKELLSRGADSKASTKRGTSVTMWAAARGFPSIVHLLKTAETPPSNSKFNSRQDSSPEQVAESPEEKVAQPPQAPETLTQKVEPEISNTVVPSDDWSISDQFTGEGIRRLGPPEVGPRRVSPWEQPITNVAPFSPFAALVDRFGRTSKIASAVMLLLVVSGFATVASWRWLRSHARVPAAPVVVTTNDSPKPVTPVETEPAAKSESASTLPAAAPEQQPEVTSVESRTPESTDVIINQPPEGQHVVRTLSRINRTPKPVYVRPPKAVTKDTEEKQNETDRPAPVTFMTKDPAPPKPAPRATNDLPPRQVAPLGNGTKKRVIQWP